MHIAVAGNIGSGKTTLTTLLSRHFKWEPHYESVDDNPYLASFYEDMRRWSFNLQVYFLNSRFRQIVKIRESGKNVIQDRTIYEDAFIFAPKLIRLFIIEIDEASLVSSVSGLKEMPSTAIVLPFTIFNSS